jgi:hypothetical protein
MTVIDESESDDGAIHRFYAWLERRRTVVDLADPVQLIHVVTQWDNEGEPDS